MDSVTLRYLVQRGKFDEILPFRKKKDTLPIFGNRCRNLEAIFFTADMQCKIFPSKLALKKDCIEPTNRNIGVKRNAMFPKRNIILHLSTCAIYKDSRFRLQRSRQEHHSFIGIFFTLQFSILDFDFAWHKTAGRLRPRTTSHKHQ